MIEHPIGPLEPANDALGSTALLFERFRVPFAALSGKEVDTMDVKSSGQAWNRVNHLMNDITGQWRSINRSQCLGTHCLDGPVPAPEPPPEDIVLAPGIDADH